MTVINSFLNSILFWAAWIIIPFVMEIIPSIGSFLILVKKKIFPAKYEDPVFWPEVTLIIPVYNSQDSLQECIQSINDSDYPNEKMRIFLVNNQGSDDSFRVYTDCQELYPDLLMQWLNAKQGKSRALNLALFNADGKYIIHVESDGQFEPHAITNMVRKFESCQAFAQDGVYGIRAGIFGGAQLCVRDEQYLYFIRCVFCIPQVGGFKIAALQYRYDM